MEAQVQVDPTKVEATKLKVVRLIANFLFVVFSVVGALSLTGVPGNGLRVLVGVCAATAITAALLFLEKR